MGPLKEFHPARRPALGGALSTPGKRALTVALTVWRNFAPKMANLAGEGSFLSRPGASISLAFLGVGVLLGWYSLPPVGRPLGVRAGNTAAGLTVAAEGEV
jgi:hypothetical protein